MADTITIGTRGSRLARWQAEHVAGRLRSLPASPDVDLEYIQTEGDKILDVALSRLPGKAFFTKELEQAILDGRVDLAVHSMKDVETEMPDGLHIGAVLEREDPRDVLIARDGLRLDTLPQGARIGTSSLRRTAFLLRWRPDLEIADLRGNVPTRIEKLDAGAYDAIVLAAAGVKRLGLGERITDYFTPDILLPAVSQGAIAIQLREGDDRVGRPVGELEHPATRAATAAERALLRTVEGGCQIPVGAHATVDGDRLDLRAVIASLDGQHAVTGETAGGVDEAVELGQALAGELLDRGGRGILAGIRTGPEAG
ncbi:MAG: hydroxymethylbilane synthase [Gemmatimonadota bacterium]|jgi:hydroxymethylbilane synthase